MNIDELIGDLFLAQGYDEHIMARDTLTNAVHTLKLTYESCADLATRTGEERDSLKTALHALQDVDYQKQLEIESLRSAYAELERERDEAVNKNDELREILNGNAKLAIQTIFGANKADIVAKHPIFGLFVDSILEIFLEQDAKNFIGVSVGNAEIGDYIVTVQKKDGKSPYERWIDAESQLAKVAEERDEARWDAAESMMHYDEQQERACKAEAKLAEAENDAEALWLGDPLIDQNDGSDVCFYCEAVSDDDYVKHKDNCPWVLHQSRKEGK